MKLRNKKIDKIKAWRRLRKLGFEFIGFQFVDESETEISPSYTGMNLVIYARTPEYWGKNSEYMDLDSLFSYERDCPKKKNKKDKKNKKKGKSK